MTASRPQPASPPSAAPAAAPSGPIATWTSFWFTPADPAALNVLRVLAGLVFLAWLLPFAGQVQALFGLNGWFDAQAYHDAARLPEVPPHLFGWSVLYLCGTSSWALTAVYWLSLAVVVLFTLGLAMRVTGVLTYVVVVSFTANPAISYDADPFLVILAFYLMLAYLLIGQRRSGLSWTERLLGPNDTWLFRRRTPDEAPPPSVAANVAVRLLQVHFAIAMVASALSKLQVREWWSGVAPWFYLHPPFHTSPEDVRAILPYADSYRVVLTLAAYVALAWQLGFPAFAWRPGWRPVLVGGAVLAWLADAFFLGMPLVGPVMVVCCLSYLSSAEWRRLGALSVRLPGLRRLLDRAAPAADRDMRKKQEIKVVSAGNTR